MDTKKVAVAGVVAIVGYMLLKGEKNGGVGDTFVENIFEAPIFPSPDNGDKDSGKEDPTTDFVSPDPDLTYKQWSDKYKAKLVEKYPIKSIKRPDTKMTILDVMDVGYDEPGIVYDVPAKSDSKLSEIKSKFYIPPVWTAEYLKTHDIYGKRIPVKK